MLFNSIDFAVFLPVVFATYWSLSRFQLKFQNLFLLVVSYVFYGWWDWRFLSLIIFSTFVDFSIGQKLKIEENEFKRKILLWGSVIVNLGFLGFFKYYNFFLDNFAAAFSLFGHEIQSEALNIILPVGISFYTFQTMSYTIDVYKRKLQATNDFIAFAAFVTFFPQLVAGPIEKAKILLPQLTQRRLFDFYKAKEGIALIVYGLFKKVVIADNLAPVVDNFYNTKIFNGLNLSEFVAVVFGYSVQIYCDFSGYSDIAIGTSLMFGISLSKNFDFPYFAKNSVEFWHRWHISLSTWFKDYVYIPLGGSRKGLKFALRNTAIVFIVSGLWHGANWTFILWGVGHLLYYAISKYFLGNSRYYLLNVGFNFIIVSFLWIPFRSVDLHQLSNIFSSLGNASWQGLPFGRFMEVKLMFLLLIFGLYEYILFRKNKHFNVVDIIILSLLILLLGNFGINSFIYFQF